MRDFERAYKVAFSPKNNHGRYDISVSEVSDLVDMSLKSSEDLVYAILTAFNYGFIKGEKKAKADAKRNGGKA